MNTEASFKQTRQKLYHTMALDGIGDMTAGLAILSLGGLIYVDTYAALFIALCAMAGPLAVFLRKKISSPRIGYYSPRSTPENEDLDPRLRNASIILLGIVIIIGLAATFGVKIPFLNSDITLVAIGLLLSIALIVFSLYTSMRRLSFYATTLLILFIHAAWSHYPTTDGMDLVREALGMHIAIFGAVLLLTGTGLLIRFINQHPVERVTEDDR